MKVEVVNLTKVKMSAMKNKEKQSIYKEQGGVAQPGFCGKKLRTVCWNACTLHLPVYTPTDRQPSEVSPASSIPVSYTSPLSPESCSRESRGDNLGLWRPLPHSARRVRTSKQSNHGSNWPSRSLLCQGKDFSDMDFQTRISSPIT